MFSADFLWTEALVTKTPEEVAKVQAANAEVNVSGGKSGENLVNEEYP